ncbi:MAG: recombinase family protein [Planctomycetales bacterium]|nr:recombinase family protein [Planctomycetales bacterium]
MTEKVWKCGLYVRVSTDMQASKEFSSLETQESVLRAFVAEKDERRGPGEPRWEVVRLYTETKSAKDTNRPVYQSLLRDIEAGAVNMIVVLALDRLSRSLPDFLNLQDWLHSRGCGFVSKRDPMLDTSLHGELITRILLVLAEYERKLTGARIKEKCAWRAQQGLWKGGQVLGYDLSTKPKGTLVPNEREAEVVRYLFHEYLECSSCRETARRANARGFTSKAYASRKGRQHPGGPFTATAAWKVLINPVYTGRIRYGGETYPGKHPALVDERTWEAVHRKLKLEAPKKRFRSRPRQHTFILEGLAECGRCSSALYPHYVVTRGVPRYYYRCKAKYNGALECSVPVVEASQLEELVLEEVRKLACVPEEFERAVAHAEEDACQVGRHVRDGLRQHRAQLARLRGEEERLVGVLKQAGLDEKSSPRAVLAELTELQARAEAEEEAVRELDEQLRTDQRVSVNRAAVRDGVALMHAVLDRLTLEEQAQLVRTYVRRVTFTPEKVQVFLYDDPSPWAGETAGALRDRLERVAASQDHSGARVFQVVPSGGA